MVSKKIIKRVLFQFICISLFLNINAQKADSDKIIKLPKQNYKLSQLFEILITDNRINLSYDSEIDKIETIINLPKDEYPIKLLINEIGRQCKTIEFITKGNNIIVKRKQIARKITISGFVSSESDGEALIGAAIKDLNSASGTMTNNYGFYSIKANAGNVELKYSFVGYKEQQLKCLVTIDTVINIKLSSNIELQEVIVNANRNEKLNSVQVSKSRVELKKIDNLPQLIGEKDLMKSIQLLPGVQSGSEGTGGLYIRGCSQGNNLVLLDGAPVYNLNHFWGLFSVFNTESLQNAELYKGGFPAQYGGRLASVLDIRMKEGNNQHYSGSGSMGLISSKMLLEGPIKKDKTSFILTGRRSNLDLLAKPFAGDENILSNLFFYDANLKINHQFSSTNRIFFSLYRSKDAIKMTLDQDFLGSGADESTYSYSMEWGNITSALRWNYIPTNKLFLNTTLTYSSYSTHGKSDLKGIINGRYQEKSDTYISNLESKTASIDLSWFPNNKHIVKFGGKYINNIYPYKKQKRLDEDNILFYDNTYFDTTFHTNEVHGYLQDEIIIFPNLKTLIGLHASYYKISDMTFHSLEPRITLMYKILPVWSAKVSYTEMTQYDFQKPDIFEGFRTENGLNLNLNPEVWLPCTELLPPQKSKQVVFGNFFSINNKFEVSIEGFYAKLHHVVDDRKLDIDEIPEIWEELFQSGNGRSYGAELLFEKKFGKLNGWMAYTLSKTERQFDKVNNGNYFPYMFDRTHNINIVLNYVLSKRFDVGVVWVYQSGRRLTLPDGQYVSAFNVYSSGADDDKNDLYALSNVNAYRLPAYHRLDIGLNFHKERKYYTRTLSLGVYNIYNRNNSFLVYTDFRKPQNSNSNDTEVVKSISLFPILPYFNYTIKF